MKKSVILLAFVFVAVASMAQGLDANEYQGQSCTSIMVGRNASTDGSVIVSHTCDGRYRTWMHIEPAADHAANSTVDIYKGTAHTGYYGDTTGLRLAGTIPQAAHTYAYLNTAYPCMNEKQLAIGETTFGGPDVLKNSDGMFLIEELQRIALQRCDNARDAIRLIGALIKRYGYGDGGECITIADKNEVWQMEILGEGPDKIGGVWAAQRIPDDHVGISANIPRIGKMDRSNRDYFMASDNVEKVAKKYKLWDGKGEFVFWKAFNSSYANGKNFREREYFILDALAPSLGLSMDMDEIPFSVKPDANVDVRKVIELFRSTYEGTDMDMCKNLKIINQRKERGNIYNDTITSPIANPWLGGYMQRTYNMLQPGAVEFRRTVAVAWCSYSHIIQLRNWLPDQVGGVCWMSVDNPGESPRIPIFCGTTRLPQVFDVCGQKGYNEGAVLWKYRKANKLATVAWQRTKKTLLDEVLKYEDKAFKELPELERDVVMYERDDAKEQITNLLNAYTSSVYDETSFAWMQLEHRFWHMFGMGF